MIYPATTRALIHFLVFCLQTILPLRYVVTTAFLYQTTCKCRSFLAPKEKCLLKKLFRIAEKDEDPENNTAMLSNSEDKAMHETDLVWAHRKCEYNTIMRLGIGMLYTQWYIQEETPEKWYFTPSLKERSFKIALCVIKKYVPFLVIFANFLAEELTIMLTVASHITILIDLCSNSFLWSAPLCMHDSIEQ